MIATLAFFIIYGGLLLTLCWHDLRYGLLPDKFTCPLLWGGLLYYLCMSPANLQHAVWGAIAGYLAFALIYCSTGEYAGVKASATAMSNFSPH